MSNFWDRIASIFRSAEESTPSDPAVHEVIERDEAFRQGFERWKSTLASRRLLDWLTDQYAVYRGKGRLDESVSFLDTPSSKGFVVHFSRTEYRHDEISYFFEYLRERIQALNYRIQVSDRRIFSRNDWVETQERHYLKPRNRGAASQPERNSLDQKFGNITLEYEQRDNQPWNLRLRATSYQDSLYREADSFRALMVALAGTPG